MALTRTRLSMSYAMHHSASAPITPEVCLCVHVSGEHSHSDSQCAMEHTKCGNNIVYTVETHCSSQGAVVLQCETSGRPLTTEVCCVVQTHECVISYLYSAYQRPTHHLTNGSSALSSTSGIDKQLSVFSIPSETPQLSAQPPRSPSC